MPHAPKPFEAHESGAYLHGTKAALSLGELLVPGYPSNFEDGRVANHIYMTRPLDAATGGAELALGEGRGHPYMVRTTGEIEDDPNVTDKRLPGNPTPSFRTKQPVLVGGELIDWMGTRPNNSRG